MEQQALPKLSLGISKEDIQNLTTYLKEQIKAEIKENPEEYFPSQPTGKVKLHSVKEVAKLLGKSDVTIRNWCHSGRLRHKILGEKNIMISQEHLDEFLQNAEV